MLMRMQCSSPILKMSTTVSQTATCVPYDTTRLLVGTYLKDCTDQRYLHIDGYCIAVHTLPQGL